MLTKLQSSLQLSGLPGSASVAQAHRLQKAVSNPDHKSGLRGEAKWQPRGSKRDARWLTSKSTVQPMNMLNLQFTNPRSV